MQACADMERPPPAEIPVEDAGALPEVAVTAQAISECSDLTFDGRTYRKCSNVTTWTDARTTCQSYGLDLVSIQSAKENAFVAQFIGTTTTWIGANDSAAEASWVWSIGNVPFLTGSAPGTPVKSRYENFPATEPVAAGSSLDCAQMRSGGAWYSASCTGSAQYLCETVDTCPGDPLKRSAGVCGCGVADTDTDADGVANCIDVCPNDSSKTTDPGVSGCGVTETDTDRDGVPNPLDEEPNDVNGQYEDDCGTATSPKPAGTACDDAPCLGVFTCDGTGRCGNASSCPIPTGGGTCVWRRFEKKGYWFCTGAQNWTAANTACRNVQGQSLVEIDSAAENAFVIANLTADAWIGGNESSEGNWWWTKYSNSFGQRFWTGAANGRPAWARYTRWLSGQPGGGTAEGCLMITGSGANRGRWDDRVCTQTRGFVCETPGPALRITNKIEPESPTINEMYDLPTPPAISYANCVPEIQTSLGSNTPHNRDRALAQAERCHNSCSRVGWINDCDQDCLGVASLPDVNETCPAWNSNETSLCMLASQHLVNNQPIECEDDDPCPDPYRCGFYAGTVLPGGKKITNRVCGTPDNNCPEITAPSSQVPSADPARCREVTLCEVQHRQVATLSGTGNDLALEQVLPNPEFGEEPTDPPVTPYTNLSAPCSGTCNLDENHPWCNYNQFWRRQNRASRVAEGRSGDGNNASPDLISFYFDPQMVIEYDATISGLGLPEAFLKAEAGLKAGIDVGPVVVDLPAFDVIDVLAAVDGSQCGLTTGRSKVRILEQDFVPVGGAELAGPLAANKQRCEELYVQLEDAVHRANKALRDAAYLIRQYYALPAGTGFGNLCNQLVSAAPRGFPPSTNCATESPEVTIDRFVRYYRESVLGFAASTGMKSVSQLASELAAVSVGSNAGEFRGRKRLFRLSPEPEELTIINAQFFIGPIPCNLEVYTALEYGVDVSLYWLLNPGGALNAILFAPAGTEQVKVAEIGVEGEPYATSSLGVFAGVGFDVGPVSAKFGVDARLGLGTVSVPAFAYAGVSLGSEPESAARELPSEFELMSSPTAEYLIPPKRYVVSLHYGAGLSAQVKDLLTGEVSARLKLKFFFFSRSWSKRIFDFDGLPDPAPFPLLCAEGTTALAAFDDQGWGKVIMPTPFPAILGPFGWGPNPPTSAPAQTNMVEEFFYDNLCTCVTGNTDQKTGLTRDCIRNDDCCSNTPYCFSDPGASPAGRKVCVAQCRARGTSCNTTSECCNSVDKCFNDPADSLSYGFCAGCRQGGQSCLADSDCCSTSQFSCMNTPGAPSYGTCQVKSACLGFCDSAADCAGTGYVCTNNQCRLPNGGCDVL